MSYTTSITLTRAWLVDPLDPTDRPIITGTVRPQDWTVVNDGLVRQYAGGRRQGANTLSVLHTVPVTLVGLSYAQLLHLTNEWQGRTLLFRSKMGERFFAVFYSVSVHNVDRSTMNDGRGFNATIDLYEVDYTESV